MGYNLGLHESRLERATDLSHSKSRNSINYIKKSEEVTFKNRIKYELNTIDALPSMKDAMKTHLQKLKELKEATKLTSEINNKGKYLEQF